MFLEGIIGITLIVYVFNLVYGKLLRGRKINGINEKAVMVTGCDSGLGLEMIKHLNSIGFVTIATCLNCNSKGYQELITKGERCKVIIMDITKEDQVIETFNEVKSYLNQMGIDGLYGLVNNAGVLINGEFDWCTWPQIKNQIDVNLTGPIQLTKLFIDDIVNNQGRLIYVTSLVSTVPFPLCSTYCSTKSGLSMFAEGLSAELDRFGVKIILLQPGDFTKLTNIVQVTVKASTMMRDSFNERKKILYGDYFSQYYSNMIKDLGIISYDNYRDSSLNHDIEEALTSVNPRLVMVQSFLWYQIIIKTISILPRNWRINISKFVQYLSRKKLINSDEQVNQ